MHAHKYLEPGTQTQLTDRVYEHAEKARDIVMRNPEVADLPEPILSVHKTCKYIFSLPTVPSYVPKPRTLEERGANRDMKKVRFRKRTLDQVLEEGRIPTCSDMGILFRGLMVAQGHPTAYVETFHEDYLLDREFHGHVFARVFNGEGSMLVNPKPNPTIVENEIGILPYVIFREGLDSWNIGIHSYRDMHLLRVEHIEELLTRYEENMQAQLKGKMEELKAMRERIQDPEWKSLFENLE